MNLRYVTSIYWSIMTMTTVGYGAGPPVLHPFHRPWLSAAAGAALWRMLSVVRVLFAGDIAAKTVTEQAVSVVCMIAGGFVFGLIIGSLSDLERKSNPVRHCLCLVLPLPLWLR